MEDYINAKRMGEAAVRDALKKGVSQYLPVLEDIPEVKDSVGETNIGLLELPLDVIVGNKEASRSNAFACNFMPLLEYNTEFAAKWNNLCESVKEEGIHHSVKCYEFMNKYYVQEGNKRISVAKYLGFEMIHADVVRVLPAKTEKKESVVYYEYLKFFDVTRCYYLTFSEPGSYEKLADLLGQNMETPWPEEVLENLKAAFFTFSKLYKTILRAEDYSSVSDGFLVYLSLFPVQSIFEDPEDQIIKNMKMARAEILSSIRPEDIDYRDDAPEEKKSGGFLDFFSHTRYTESNPLRVGFIYNDGVENSRWVDSHEAGRLYAAEIIGPRVATASYMAKRDGSNLAEVLQKAVDDKNDLIFTISSKMITETVKFAMANPSVKFMNCSVGYPHPSIRCYHGKMYEASFLAGILAANTLLSEELYGDHRRIGYLLGGVKSSTYANLNAFAMGVSLIDPKCRISLKYTGDGEHENFKDEWYGEGVCVFADFGYSKAPGAKEKPGIYRMSDEGDIFIGAPYTAWGRYYSIIFQSVISGAWNLSAPDSITATNYWFGLSTGVVDLVVSGIPYQTEKMLSFFKSAIISGGLDPFSGEIHSQTGVVQERKKGSSRVTAKLESMTAGNIITMNWLNENIDGTIPQYISVK